MKTYLSAFVISFTLSLFLTPIMARVGRRLLKLRPQENHHSHTLETPRLGGIVILFSFFAPLAGFFFYENTIAQLFLSETKIVFGFYAGGLAVLLLGCWDDIFHVPAKWKLLFEILIATFVYFCGFKITILSFPFVEEIHLGVFSYLITVCWIVGLMNALNLIDGLDALALGIALFASVTLGVIAFINGHILTTLYACALTGALLGFLRYNSYPAKIFLGDSGSLFIGYILAIVSIQDSVKSSTAVAILTPVIALGIPFLDMMVSIVRRYFRGLSFFAADKDHIHHRLLKMGFTPRKAVLILYGLCILLNGLALFLFVSKNQSAGFVLIGITVASLFALGYVGYLRPQFFRERAQDMAFIKSLRKSRYLLRSLKENSIQEGSFWDRIWQLTVQNCQVLNIDEVQLEWIPDALLALTLEFKNFRWRISGEKNTDYSADKKVQLELPLMIQGQLLGNFKFSWTLEKERDNGVKFFLLEYLVEEIGNLTDQYNLPTKIYLREPGAESASRRGKE